MSGGPYSDDLALLYGQKHVLQLVATGAPLADTLSELIVFVEAQEPGMRCGILIVAENGTHFCQSIGPNLSPAFHAVAGVARIAPPYLAACPQAVHEGVPVVVPDVANDERFPTKWRNILKSCGLASLRSTPVRAPDGQILASFAMFYEEPRDPHPRNPQLIEVATHLAAIALQRRREEEVARRGEAFYRSLAEALPAPLYTTDAEGCVVFYNAAAADLWGRRPKPGNFQWCGAAQTYRPDGSLTPAEQSPLAVALREQRPVRGQEVIVERPDGSRSLIEAYSTPLYDASGVLAGGVNMLLDMTDRRRAENALQEQETRLRTVIETVPSAVWFSHGRDARLVTGNRYAAELLRIPQISNHSLTAWPAERPQGFHVRKNGVQIPAERLPLQRAARGEDVAPEECEIVFQDGTATTVLIQARSLRDRSGTVVGAVCTAIDITERKRSEDVLRRSEQEFRALGEDQPNLCWIADANGWIYWYNKRWYEYTGTTSSEMEGWGWQSVHDPDVLRQVTERWAHAIASGSVFEMTFPLRRADGVFRPFLTRIVPVRDERGKITRWFGSNVDIGEQQATENALRASEEALKSLNEHLEARVAAEVAAREQAQQLLAHGLRMEALGQLAGGIAHDFNNVLQAVSGGLSLIEKRAADSEAVRRLARMAADAAARGAAITGRLLSFARQGELRAVPVPLLLMLQGIQEILASTLGVGINVRIEVASDTPPLLADTAQLETVLINLAVNARDAMKAGGILTISARPDSGDLPRPFDGSRDRTYVRLDLKDSGVGMDAVTLARASEPFFTTKPPGQGTGLGLAMARGFAQQSGGGFAIQSTSGRGTTVTLWFPTAEAESDAPASSRATAFPDSLSARVLLVDDDAMVREALAGQLKELGYRVRQASDGLAALTMLDADERVDLLVTDLSMPGMNGLMLIQEARRRRSTLPALLLTGYADANLQIESNGAPDTTMALLRKPVLESELAEKAGALLAFPNGSVPALEEGLSREEPILVGQASGRL